MGGWDDGRRMGRIGQSDLAAFCFGTPAHTDQLQQNRLFATGVVEGAHLEMHSLRTIRA